MTRPLRKQPAQISTGKRALYFFLAMLTLASLPLFSQAQSGTDMYDAIPVGSFSSCGGSTFYDYRNNSYYNGIYYYDNYNYNYNYSSGQPSSDVWYTFTVGDYADMTFSLCGSYLDTYVHVIDEYGNVIDYNDDSYGCGTSSYLNIYGLSAGTYYLVVEGTGYNTDDYSLEISSQSSGTPPGGANLSNAINAGTFSSSGTYSNAMSNADPCLGNDYGQPSNDIYYQFTLNNQATVKLSHCGSGFDTYMWLLNSSGGQITYNDDTNTDSPSPCAGTTQSYIETTLGAGTYYVVSEGYNNNIGTITTNITVQMVSPPSISYPAPAIFVVGQSVSLTPVNSGGAINTSGQSTTTYATGFYNPLSTATDGQGNVYVADAGNHQIKKIAPGGTVSVLAGAGYAGYSDGTGTSAVFRHPSFLAVDGSGNVFVADQQNHRIRKITPSGVVSTFAGSGSGSFSDGTGTSASFQYPMGLAFDGSGNLYVADAYNQRIRKITPSGVVSTYAGTGAIGSTNSTALSSTFNYPMGINFDASGNLYVADRVNHMVRKITPSGVVSTLAGSGTAGYAEGNGSSAQFNASNSVAVDASGTVYLVDQNNNRVRQITPSGTVSTLAGTGSAVRADGTGSAVSFNSPFGMSIDGQGANLYVAENASNVVRKVTFLRAYMVSPALPAGLALNGNTGEISGTPTASSPPASYTVTAYGAGGTGSTTLTISVQGSCLDLSQDQNYIVSYSPREKMASDGEVLASSCDPYKVNTAVQYFDGLGRPLQTVQVKGNSDATKDIVQPIEYDQYGRETRKYLPYASTSNDGSYKTDALTTNSGVFNFYNPSPGGNSGDQMGNGIARNPFPFSQTVFEPSPLNRVTEQGAPGAAWQPVPDNTTGHTMKIGYGSNATGEVKLWTVTSNGATATTYNANELYKTTSKDENWKETDLKAGTTEEFKDKEGRVVLKRVWETDSKSLSTYYLYDDFGNLRYVLPPAVNENGKLAAALTTVTDNDTDFNNYIYAYRYDGRKRLIEKKVPGKGWEWMVYNKLDQIVLTQDAVQRNASQWLFTKYDALGRTVSSGIYSSSGSRLTEQANVDNATVLWEGRSATNSELDQLNMATGYTDLAYPTAGLTYLTLSYYDDYSFPGYNLVTESVTKSNMTRGLPTGSKIYLADGTSGKVSAMYYDPKGMMIESVSENHVSGLERIVNTYNFVGELLTSTRNHSGPQSLKIVNTYTYDHVGRRKQTTSNINDATSATILSSLTYNEIGQLRTKAVGNGINTSTYSYNERGWLKSQGNDIAPFNMMLDYQENNSQQYNGNISKQTWGTIANPATYNYLYTYDKLNRLLTGISNDGKNEELTYDVMGNILSLNRNDLTGPMSYSYQNGNQLSSISGGLSSSYGYDVNGNQTTDVGKGLTFEYNYLNLPKRFYTTTQEVNNIWRADGTKVRKIAPGVTRDYVGGIEYNNGTIEFVHTEEGRAFASGSSYVYEYMIKDHLGNTRILLNQTGTPLESTDYYPFGKTIARGGGTVPSPLNNYKYNGKELQQELGLGQYDYGARFYDPVIGRWNVVDPKAELGRRWSPYNYTFNNPIRFTDPDGMWPWPPIFGGPVLTKNVAEFAMKTASVVANTAIAVFNSVSDPVSNANYAGNTKGAKHDAYTKAATQGFKALTAETVIGVGVGKIAGKALQGLAKAEASGTAKVLDATSPVSSTAGTTETNVYRVFGGDAKPDGFSWTPNNPNGVANFRDAAGLPSGGASGSTNTGQFVIEGTVDLKNIINQRSALPLDGNRGGLQEYIINPKDVIKKRVSGANPEF